MSRFTITTASQEHMNSLTADYVAAGYTVIAFTGYSVVLTGEDAIITITITE